MVRGASIQGKKSIVCPPNPWTVSTPFVIKGFFFPPKLQYIPFFLVCLMKLNNILSLQKCRGNIGHAAGFCFLSLFLKSSLEVSCKHRTSFKKGTGNRFLTTRKAVTPHPPPFLKSFAASHLQSAQDLQIS